MTVDTFSWVRRALGFLTVTQSSPNFLGLILVSQTCQASGNDKLDVKSLEKVSVCLPYCGSVADIQLKST